MPPHGEVERLLAEIDARWQPLQLGRVPLRILGSTALFLQCDYRRATKDGDVLETSLVEGPVRDQLVQLAGHGTDIHQLVGIYVDIVPARLPLLPPEPTWIPEAELSARLTHFTVEVLAPVDVVISKLGRFKPNDVADIRAAVLRKMVEHDELVQRFALALNEWEMDARADEFADYIARMHRIERDFFGVEPSEFPLPAWLEE